MIKKFYGYFSSVGIFVAATFGAGIFALPKTFELGGWVLGSIYLVALSGILIYCHYIFWLALQKKGNPSLLGLINSELGGWARRTGFISVILGLLLTLTAYLVLGGEFLQRIFNISPHVLVLVFWAVCSLPILFNFSRFVFLEVLGVVLMIGAVIYLFILSPESGRFFSLETVNLKNIFLPFGPFIAALAGWTAIEPMIKRTARDGINNRPVKVLIFGALAIVVLYFIFSVAIVGSSSVVSGDSVSGINLISVGVVGLLSFLGLFAVWTSYLPIVLEVKKAVYRDLKLGEAASFMIPTIVPILGLWAGLDSFFEIMSFVGGIFLSTQYVLITFASKKALGLKGWKSFLADTCGVIFASVAVYELALFIF